MESRTKPHNPTRISLLGWALVVAGFLVYILPHKLRGELSNPLVSVSISLIFGFVGVHKGKVCYTFLLSSWAIFLTLDSTKRTPLRKPLSINSTLILLALDNDIPDCSNTGNEMQWNGCGKNVLTRKRGKKNGNRKC